MWDSRRGERHLGVTLTPVPTKHPRISVVRDAQLDEALQNADRLLGPASPATRVRELAIRGAKALDQDGARQAELLERAAKRMTTPGWMGGLSLEEIRRGAWGIEDA